MFEFAQRPGVVFPQLVQVAEFLVDVGLFFPVSGPFKARQGLLVEADFGGYVSGGVGIVLGQLRVRQPRLAGQAVLPENAQGPPGVSFAPLPVSPFAQGFGGHQVTPAFARVVAQPTAQAGCLPGQQKRRIQVTGPFARPAHVLQTHFQQLVHPDGVGPAGARKAAGRRVIGRSRSDNASKAASAASPASLIFLNGVCIKVTGIVGSPNEDSHSMVPR